MERSRRAAADASAGGVKARAFSVQYLWLERFDAIVDLTTVSLGGAVAGVLCVCAVPASFRVPSSASKSLEKPPRRPAPPLASPRTSPRAAERRRPHAAAEGDGAGRAHDRPREPVDPRRHGPRAVPAQRVVAPEPDHGRRLLRRASAASAAPPQLRTPRPQDFSAHIAYACAHNVRRGDDVESAVRGALEDLGASVLNGGLSTLLAVTVLAFSDYYAYFQMFIMFLAMVLSGLLHGLVLLPALFLILF